MKVISHTLDCHDAPIQIMPLSDLHIGDAHSDSKLIEQRIKQIRETENRYTVLDGDLMNTAIAGSKSDIYGETMPPMQQLERCVEYFGPLAEQGKILAILPGNHEERIYRQTGVDMSALMAAQLGLSDVYSPTSALLFLRFGESRRKRGRKQNYSLFVYHGSGGGGRRAGGKVNALEDMARIVTADVYVMGHTHQPASLRRQHYVTNTTNHSTTLIDQLFVNTAATLDWSGSYGDRMGYQPSSKQTPVITLAHDRHYASVTI